ncbi:ribosomal protein S5 domain 2-like protein [Dacryopinax primogenitus]|uniref:Ribosomal protein S5 domain 2-like protein n=1 Tax=Dacryopinax primogenitus (strain DJM 731) TaxID=1858805 RepID=M5FT28_DACPD|nr:ribosomal protein S5 domain 2-like protein [Dacryopinax primogenitus]EJU00701.1 ribosomal protein S5 domain 2-like protein [Dacryopinax primogenitus]
MRDTKPDFDYPVGVAKYKRLISVLDDLARIRGVARYAGLWEMYDRLSDAVRQFDTGKGEATVGERKRGELDAYGRSYAHSGRKTSSARAWMIPTDPGLPTARPQTEGGTPAATTSATHFLTSKILINSAPLSTYFTQTLDRERVVRPLRVTGLLGAFNIFALVRGGGTTGQADAVASAVARAIMLHAPQMKGALAEAGLLHRDPRMVERKKTNLLKAREARTWTKR